MKSPIPTQTHVIYYLCVNMHGACEHLHGVRLLEASALSCLTRVTQEGSHLFRCEID